MQVKTQLDDIQNYLTDASNMSGGQAERLFIPETVDEIAGVLREANGSGTPVTISGARTGTVGGAIPLDGTVVSLERLNNIEINKAEMTATVGAGVILADLQKAVGAEGLFYPPDPTEWSCQIGGTVATNASGARSFKYGATREFVRALKIVLADGDILELRREECGSPHESRGISSGGHDALTSCGLLQTESGRDILFKVPTYERPNVRKNVSGYFNASPLDAIDLFIGSEGTLGVITEIELRLLRKPEGFFSGIVFFPNKANLLGFVDRVRNRSFSNRRSFEDNLRELISRPRDMPPFGVPRPGGCVVSDEDVAGWRIDAALIEYFDQRALSFISEKFPETPDGMAGAIFFEQETTAEDEDSLLESWNELLEIHNADLERSWFTTNDQDREKMRAFRHALPVSVNERITHYGLRKVGTDMAVPDENFTSFLRYYKETLDSSGLDYVIFGHIGDCHLHANMLPKNTDEAVKARHIYGRCVAQAIMLGGCVSAEHGIGKLKRKYLSAMMGERYLNEMAEIKRAFDPKGILGRGNMFDETYL